MTDSCSTSFPLIVSLRFPFEISKKNTSIPFSAATEIDEHFALLIPIGIYRSEIDAIIGPILRERGAILHRWAKIRLDGGIFDIVVGEMCPASNNLLDVPSYFCAVDSAKALSVACMAQISTSLGAFGMARARDTVGAMSPSEGLSSGLQRLHAEQEALSIRRLLDDGLPAGSEVPRLAL